MYRIVCFVALLFFSNVDGELKVSINMEGASAKNILVSGNSITFHPGGDGDRGFTCWWYAKVEGVDTSKPFSVTVDAAGLKQSRDRAIGSYWALPDRMTFSYDQTNWLHSGIGKNNKTSSTWAIKKPERSTVWVAWGAPYTPSNSKSLSERLPPEICKPFILCKTRGGREVQAMKVTSLKNTPKKVIWIQARQHAWESGSSWVGEGLMEWISGDSEKAIKFRDRAIVYFVPIMDVDNVATGNGGKEQHPHDHNRDWSAKPHWNSVAAAQEIIATHIKEGTMSLFIDLHNPGPGSKETFLFAAPLEIMSKSNQRSQINFIKVLKESVTGPIPFKGKVQISGKNYHPMWKTISKSWFVLNSTKNSCGVTIEIPWNTAKSLPDGYKKTGSEIAQAIFSHLN